MSSQSRAATGRRRCSEEYPWALWAIDDVGRCERGCDMAGLFRRPHQLSDGRKRAWWWDDNIVFDGGHAPRMGAWAFLIRAFLLRCANGQNLAFPSLTDIQQATGVSRAQIRRQLAHLVRLGYLRIRTPGRSVTAPTVYEIVDLADAATVLQQSTVADDTTVLPQSTVCGATVFPQSTVQTPTVLHQSTDCAPPEHSHNKEEKRENKTAAKESAAAVSGGAEKEQARAMLVEVGIDADVAAVLVGSIRRGLLQRVRDAIDNADVLEDRGELKSGRAGYIVEALRSEQPWPPLAEVVQRRQSDAKRLAEGDPAERVERDRRAIEQRRRAKAAEEQRVLDDRRRTRAKLEALPAADLADLAERAAMRMGRPVPQRPLESPLWCAVMAELAEQEQPV